MMADMETKTEAVEIDVDKLRRLWKTYMTLDAIASVFDVSPQTLRKVAADNLLPVRTRGPRPKKTGMDTEFRQLYDQGMTFSALADHFKMSRSAVARRVSRLTLPARRP